LKPLDVGPKLHGMLSPRIKQIVVHLIRIPMKLEGSLKVQPSGIAGKAIRVDGDRTNRTPGYETKRRIGRSGIDWRRSRRRFHIVTIEAHPEGIQ
jgi:hypothetical protein